MPQNDYTYAVARVRSRENLLLSNLDLEQLLNQKDYASCIRFLHEKGWGDSSKEESYDDILSTERERIWSFIGELVDDKSVFDIFLVPNDFHNLKVSVKAITRDAKTDGMFIDNGKVPPLEIYSAVEKREYERLPEYLQAVANDSMKALLQTSDGQLCDVIIDRACLEYVYKIGAQNENEIIRLYCELFVASADIKIAVRCARCKKSYDFALRSMAPCNSLNIEKLASAASKSFEDIISYLSETDYKSSVDAINTSMSSFEKWCDDYLTNVMKPQKWEPFTIGPLVAYIIARENEIKAVRMILSGKLNGLDSDVVRERLREMYV